MQRIDPKTAQSWVARGEAVLIDIREPLEHAREHIPGAMLVPLARLAEGGTLPTEADGRRCVFHCRSGSRTAANAALLDGIGPGEAFVLDGGIDGWKAAGQPVAVNRSVPIDIMRQVQIVVGTLVLAGLALAALVSPWFALVSAFVGAGLVFAGITGFCGMARLLALMPWNRLPEHPAA